MNKTKSRIFITITTLVIMLSNTLSFAAPTVFTDISGHWAKEHIEDIYNQKITTGYNDATFKPQGNISKLETIVMVAKLMGYTSNEEAYYINQYKQQLEKNNIPQWGKGAAAYALFNDILLEEDLAKLVSTNQQTYAKRYEVVTYIGRVLQHGAGKQVGTIYVIPYIDEMSIPTEAAPYIDLLLKNGILDKESNGGRFLPNNSITRAEVAKLVSLSAEILNGASTGTPTTPPVTDVDNDNSNSNSNNNNTDIVRKTINGDIDNVILGTKDVISIVSGSSTVIYDIASNAKITVDGKTVTVDKLEKGLSITAIVENNIIVNINGISNNDVIEGYFYYYLDGAKPTVFITDSKENIKSLNFTKNSKIYLNDKAVGIGDLSAGDIISIKYMDEQVIEIEAESKEKTFEGVIKKISNTKKDENTIEVILKDKTTETFTITSDATLKRDRKSVKFEEIRVGDEVEIVKEYDKVSYLNAYSVKKTEKGYIKTINIGKKTEITIEKYDGDIEVFEITPKTEIRIEEKKAGTYDLRTGYEVELEIENDEVVWMESYRKLQGVSYQGKVIDVDSREETIELEIKAGEEIVINVDRATIYNDERGEIIRFRDIDEDDEIVVYADDNGYYIVAKRVFVLIRR